MPGQWSPQFNPGTKDHRFHSGDPTTADRVNTARVRLAEQESIPKGYSGHGIPSGTWSSSTDETSSASTRTAPGPVGQWSPYSTPQSYDATPRDLQATPTTKPARNNSTAPRTVSGPTSARTTTSATPTARSSKPAGVSLGGRASSTVKPTATSKPVASVKPTASAVSSQAHPSRRVSNATATSGARRASTSSGRTASTHVGNATRVGTKPVNLHGTTSRPAVHQAGRVVEHPTAVRAPVRAPVVEEVVGPAHVRPVTLQRPQHVVEEVRAPVVVEEVLAPVIVEEVFAPVVVEEAVFEEHVLERPSSIIEIERPGPVIETATPINEYNKAAFPGLIFGVDEEIDIERCYYEEIEYIKEPQVEEYYEEGVIATPHGTEYVRSPTFAHITRPAMEHDEIYQKCVHKTIIAPTSEIGVKIPQVRYINITQIRTGTFEWPVVRKAHVLPRKTVEKTVSIPQMGFVDLCQDHPTNETAVSIPQVHTVIVEQIVHTEECEVNIPQVHTVWIPIMQVVNIPQHKTETRRVHLKQEWDCTIKCEDTRVHFIKFPQKDEGVTGTVIKNAQDEETNICHNCYNAKCAGVGPALMPFLVEESATTSAAPVRVETKYVEVIKEVPIPCPEPEQIIVEVPAATESSVSVAPAPVAAAVVAEPQEPTEIHHISLGQCPCSAVAVNQPVQFLEEGAAAGGGYAGGFPWWLLPLLLLAGLLLSMLLAWLLCAGRKRKEVVAAPIQPESPKRKFVIEKQTQEENEEEIEKEIARQLKQRVEARGSSPDKKVVEEEKKIETQVEREEREVVKAQVVEGAAMGAGAAGVEAAEAKEVEKSPKPQAKQDRPASPGGSQRSSGRRGSSRGSGSSKKVVKKRIVKMMKQGQLVAEKVEILDEEGNVIRTEIRKEGLSTGSPARSQN